MEVKKNLILKFKSSEKMISKSVTDLNKCGIRSNKKKIMMENVETLMEINGEDHHQLWLTMFIKVNYKTIKRNLNKHQLLIEKLLKSMSL